MRPLHPDEVADLAVQAARYVASKAGGRPEDAAEFLVARPDPWTIVDEPTEGRQTRLLVEFTPGSGFTVPDFGVGAAVTIAELEAPQAPLDRAVAALVALGARPTAVEIRNILEEFL